MRIKNYFLVMFLLAVSGLSAQVNTITGTILDANAILQRKIYTAMGKAYHSFVH